MDSKSRRNSIMKKFIALLLFIPGMLTVATAQDIITLKSGEDVTAKVKEVELSVIKYVRFDNQTGPVYTIEKADVFMIKYENGTKDVFDYQPLSPVSPSQIDSNSQSGVVDKLTSAKGGAVMKDRQKLKPYEVKAIMTSNYAALKRYKGGRAFNTLGIIFVVIGGIDIGLGISYTLQGYDASGNFLIGALEIGAGFLFSSISNTKIQSSVLIYNSGLKNQHTSTLNLGLTQNGLGLCLNF